MTVVATLSATQRYLVTGASGFLGTHLVEALEARGHEVVRFSRSTGGDVLDPLALRSAARGCEGVFHCAGKVSRKPEDAETLYLVHVQGTRNVIDACVEAGVRRLVIASTSGTVAVSEDPWHVAQEDDASPLGLVGRWPYYRAKLFAEQAALAANRPGFEVVSINPSLLLGPGDVHDSSTGDVRMFLEGGVSAVPAGGISFVDVRDAADVFCAAMDLGRPGERYFVGACNITLRDFLLRLSRISGVPIPWIAAPRSRALARFGASVMHRVASAIGGRASLDLEAAEMAQYFWYLDAAKAANELAFAPRDPNVTLLDTVEDLRTRGVVWPRDSTGSA